MFLMVNAVVRLGMCPALLPLWVDAVFRAIFCANSIDHD